MKKHHMHRRFRVHEPADRDIVYLVMTQYEWDETDGFITGERQMVLTNNGWQEFEPWEAISMNDLPSIDGMDWWLDQRIETKLNQFKQLIEGNIAQANPATPDNQGKEDISHG